LAPSLRSGVVGFDRKFFISLMMN